MAGKFSKTTTPGTGYTDAVTQSRPPTDSSGRGVPDERRGFSADPTHTPPGLSAEGADSPEDAGTESDEAPSGRVQGG